MIFSFIQLIDYLQTNMMQDLMHNTYKVLINTLQSHTKYISSDFYIDPESQLQKDLNSTEARLCPDQV